MRGFRAMVMLLLSSMLLSGCWDRTEINDLAIVLATGVDYKDGQAQLTAPDLHSAKRKRRLGERRGRRERKRSHHDPHC